MMISTNPDVRALICWALKQYPWLEPERGGRHWKIRNRRSLDFIPIPFSPSDRARVIKHLRVQLRRLAEKGVGYIASKRS